MAQDSLVADFGLPITLLHSGTHQTTVASGTGNEPASMLTLAIGSPITAADYFKHNPSTPGELENAIMRSKTK